MLQAFLSKYLLNALLIALVSISYGFLKNKLGEVTSYKRLYMQFRDSAAKTINLTLNNPKNVDDGDYADFAAQDAAVQGVMDTIITKNIFHNDGNDLVAKVNARILDYKSTDVMDV